MIFMGRRTSLPGCTRHSSVSRRQPAPPSQAATLTASTKAITAKFSRRASIRQNDVSRKVARKGASSLISCFCCASLRQSIPCSSCSLRGLPRDLRQELEKAAFAVRTDAPVHRHALIAVIKALAFHAEIEIAPRGSLAHRGEEVVLRLVEGEVVVFVEQDWFGRIAGHRARLANHCGDPLRIPHSIAVQEQEIRRAHHVLPWNRAASITCADEQ